MELPTEEQCLGYFEEYIVPNNILKHCLKVREVSVFLAKKLKENGIKINVELVDRSALLHDMFKMVAIKDPSPNRFYNFEFSEKELEMREKLREKYPGMFECEVAYEVFKDEFPEMASTVRNASNPKNTDKTWEEQIVHYADWRVLKEGIVSAQERVYYLKQRYPGNDELWEKYLKDILEDEERIFMKLNFNPEELAEKFGGAYE